MDSQSFKWPLFVYNCTCFSYLQLCSLYVSHTCNFAPYMFLIFTLCSLYLSHTHNFASSYGLIGMSVISLPLPYQQRLWSGLHKYSHTEVWHPQAVVSLCRTSHLDIAKIPGGLDFHVPWPLLNIHSYR